MLRITPDFFKQSPVECARALIGAEFRWDGCMGRIVETEAYSAEGDPACHTWFRPSARQFVATHPAGASYVYLNYGVHWLFNILVKGPKESGFVLLRALQPIEGLETMTSRRKVSDLRKLCSGPGKLTAALGITGADHGSEFLSSSARSLQLVDTPKVVACVRIGISSATDLEWRFLEAGSPFASRPAGRKKGPN